MIKLAQLYENIKTQVALDYLKQVIELDPSYVPGLFSYSQILYRKGFYPEALNAFKKYLTLVEPDAKDYERYATLLYFNKMYKESLEAIEKAPDNLVMNRLKTYAFLNWASMYWLLKARLNSSGNTTSKTSLRRTMFTTHKY